MKKSTKKYIPEFVYGSIDGLITTFAIVTGSAGASLSPGVIVVIGLASVLADGFSMGSSSYLSAISEHALHGKQKKHTHVKTPSKKGMATFSSFAVVGIIPLVPYIFALMFTYSAQYALYASIVLTVGAFGVVGFASGVVTNEPPIRTALRTTVIGSIAAIIAFSVGRGLSTLFGI